MAEEELEGYDSGQYVQEKLLEGIIVTEVSAQEELEGYAIESRCRRGA